MREVIDAEFTEVETPYRPFRFPWFSAFWFVGTVAGAATYASQVKDPAQIAITVCAVSIVWPMYRLFALVAEQVSESEAQRLKRHLSRPAGT
jgi:hypothetical protein